MAKLNIPCVLHIEVYLEIFYVILLHRISSFQINKYSIYILIYSPLVAIRKYACNVLFYRAENDDTVCIYRKLQILILTFQ